MSFQFTNNWPYSGSTIPTMDDHVDPVNNIYFTGLHREITQIEYFLGLHPQGAFANVAGRLDSIQASMTKKSCTVVVGTNSSNGDYTDIQQAVDFVQAAGGGLVYIREGTYTIASKITLTTNSNIIIQGSGTKTKIISSATLTSLIEIGSQPYPSSFIVIRDINFDGNAEQSGSAGLIGSIGCNNLVVSNCYFYNSAARGIRASDSTHLIIYACTFYYNWGTDIDFAASCAWTIVSSCQFLGKHSVTNGISAGWNYTIVVSNAFYNYEKAILLNGSNITCCNNTITNSTLCGIYLEAVVNSVISNNNIKYSDGVGLYGETCESVAISGNHISHSKLQGMLFYGMVGCAISNNVLFHNSQLTNGNWEITFHPSGVRGNIYNSIIGNVLRCGFFSNGMNQFDNTNDKNTIVGNSCSDYNQYGIVTGGTYNDFGHNINW